MKSIRNTGIEISEKDGIPLASGNYKYWDAEISNVIKEDLGNFCPAVAYSTKDNNHEAFTALFRHFSKSGDEICSASTSIKGKKKAIPENELEQFVHCLDKLHQRAEQDNIPSELRDLIKTFRVPDPWKMSDSWRLTNGFVRHLLVLWGYAAFDSNATVLPLTETSKHWEDAGQRVDIREKVGLLVSKGAFNWKKLFKYLLWILLLVVVLFSGIKILGSILPSANCDQCVVPSPPIDVCDICKTPLRNGKCPNICPIHNNAHYIDGKCPKRCPECNEHLDANGRCKNICDVHPEQHKINGMCPKCVIVLPPPIDVCDICKTPLRNGKCPNICPTHNNIHYVNDKCPERCPECQEHLDINWKCPYTCDVHPEQHKRNGLCPQCDKVISSIDFFIEKKSENERNGIYYPEFGVQSGTQDKIVGIKWFVDGIGASNGEIFSPKNGFAPNDIHNIEAEIIYSRNGENKKFRTPPYTWQKDIESDIVERHISLIGAHHTDKKGDYYILKVCSNPEEKIQIETWEITMDDYGKLKYESENEFPDAIRLYVSEIPGEGKLSVTAKVKNKSDKRVNVQGAFFYSTSTITVSGSFDADLTERWTTIKHLIEPSIFLCFTNKGYGTAFAVSSKDLLTNNHVIENCEGNVSIFNRGLEKPINVRIVQTDPDRDIAWLQITEKFELQPLFIASNLSKKGTPVGAFGFPYSAVETDISKLPDMGCTYGAITNITKDSIFHDADIYSGNSGGPLIDIDGKVVGVNTLVSFTKDAGEMKDKINVAFPILFMVDTLQGLKRKMTFSN